MQAGRSDHLGERRAQELFLTRLPGDVRDFASHMPLCDQASRDGKRRLYETSSVERVCKQASPKVSELLRNGGLLGSGSSLTRRA